ncbi:hypothetical protein CHUAL_000784 [Chamberlinius hualienensis]
MSGSFEPFSQEPKKNNDLRHCLFIFLPAYAVLLASGTTTATVAANATSGTAASVGKYRRLSAAVNSTTSPPPSSQLVNANNTSNGDHHVSYFTANNNNNIVWNNNHPPHDFSNYSLCSPISTRSPPAGNLTTSPYLTLDSSTNNGHLSDTNNSTTGYHTKMPGLIHCDDMYMDNLAAFQSANYQVGKLWDLTLRVNRLTLSTG